MAVGLPVDVKNNAEPERAKERVKIKYGNTFHFRKS